MSSHQDAIRGVDKWLDERPEDDPQRESMLELKQQIMDLAVDYKQRRMKAMLGGANIDKDTIVEGEAS